MIFVTLGSQKFQFNRLLKEIDSLIAKKVITEEVFAQIGASDYEPKHYQYEKFLDRDTFRKKMEKSDLVITHGGTGAIMGALKKGKKVIAVPRLAKYGEHVDDHQVQLLKEFNEMELIEACFDCNKLKSFIKKIKFKVYKDYSSNTDHIIKSIETYILK